MAYPNPGGPYNPSQLSYPGGAPAPSGPGGYYGGPPAAPAVAPEVQQWFDAVDQDRSGRITATELQSALVNGQGKNFNMPVCQLMIGMFDKDGSGTIDVEGFQHLYRYVNQWLETFRGLDRDQSGVVEEAELGQAFSQMGYRFSQPFVQTIVRRADPNTHRVSVDQFILLCIQIQKFTDAFRSRDHEMKGEITISFEDFLTVALSCS